MRIPYGFTLTSSGTLEINRSEAIMGKKFFGVSTKKTWKVLCKY